MITHSIRARGVLLLNGGSLNDSRINHANRPDEHSTNTIASATCVNLPKRKVQRKALCRQVNDTMRHQPDAGMGKPEALKHSVSGLWSRRLSQHDRLIYAFDELRIDLFAIGGHCNQR
ncbi:MAG: type II toxin-antitoxin system YoeB family toxin [Pseudomonadota bacterium]